MGLLYRGVSKTADEENGGRLLPKGSEVKVVPLCDGKWKFDGTFYFGPCETNTARAHQIDSGLYGGAGISTSRSEEVAIYFATMGHLDEGYVYVIDESLLERANVTAHEFPNPVEPHEKEVTLIEKSGGALPESVIVEKYEVDRDGRRVRPSPP